MSRTPLQWHTVYPDGWYYDGRRRVSDDEDQRLPPAYNNPYSIGQQPPQFLHPENRGYDPTMISPSQPRPPIYGRAPESAAEPGLAFSSGSTTLMAQPGVQRTNLFKGVDYSGAQASYDHRGSIGSGGRVNEMDSHVTRYSSSSTSFPSPGQSDKSMAFYPQTMPFAKQQQQQQQQFLPPPPQQPPQRHTMSSMPMGFERLLNHSPSPSPPPLPSPRCPPSSRYHLHIRQQPVAARACGAGDRDRRPVDPPPIIQMLLTDFDPHSDTDSEILQDPRFAVGCLLVPVSASSDTDPEPGLRDNHPAQRDAGAGAGGGQTTPLLSGKAFVSPFYVDADPDPNTAPPHPSSSSIDSSSLYSTSISTPFSLPNPNPNPNPNIPPKTSLPATFYIFSDLSVRTAGLYRLQFRLMNWGSVEDTGRSMPVLAETWSAPFRVYPAKDFPGMRDSSALTRGLKELGFVELKTRGRGEGKGRRAR